MQQSAGGRQTLETCLNSIMARSNTQLSRERALRDATMVAAAAAAAVMTAAVVGTATAAAVAAAMTHRTKVTHPPRPNVVMPGLTVLARSTAIRAITLTMTPSRDTPTRGRGSRAKVAKAAAGTANQTQNVTGQNAVCSTAAGVAAQGSKARLRAAVVAEVSAAVVESTARTANIAAATNAVAAAAESTVAVETGVQLQDMGQGQEGMGAEVL